MTIVKTKSSLLVVGISSLISSSVLAADRQIEEVVVTAEKIEATVSDTSISITAFSADAIEEFGMQGADDMVNYIPATTRDDYDIRIRGVGRNYRALGGDPGVSTYYNGVYSPDFGIAASENALYDIERIEVLRGPQGTLYGRNAIGGALNYITKEPTFNWTGNLRTQLGNFNDREIYGVISGPLIEDTLAFRGLAIKRDRDGTQDGINDSLDANSVDDRNFSLALTWNVNDAVTVKVRGNDRRSDRVIGAGVILQEGNVRDRQRRTDTFGSGMQEVAIIDSITGIGRPATDAEVLASQSLGLGNYGQVQEMFNFTASNGQVLTGRYVRPGQDSAPESFLVNQAYGQASSLRLIQGASPDDPNNKVDLVDSGTGSCAYPYTERNCQHELFEHRASQNEVNWDISDNLSLKYIFGTNDFVYTYNIMTGYGDSPYTKPRSIVEADTQSKSHEVQLFWNPTDSISITSGVYLFDELRFQDFAVADTERFVNPATYTDATQYGINPFFINDLGFLNDPNDVATEPTFRPNGAAVAVGECIECTGLHARLGQAPEGSNVPGFWFGDERGDYYSNKTTLKNRATAVYTQATWDINEEFALVLGVRYAEDERHAREFISGYTEVNGGFGSATTAFSAFDGVNLAPFGGFPGYSYGPNLDSVSLVEFFPGPGGTFATGFTGFFISPGGVAALQGLGLLGNSLDAGGTPISPFVPGGVPVPVTTAGGNSLTDLAWVNVAMGNASWDKATGEFTPTCPLEEQDTCANPLLLQGFPISYNSHVAGSDTWRDTNFRVNLDWTPNDDILMYFSVTSGYRAGGYSLGVLDAKSGLNSTGLTPRSYDQEEVIAYEIGYKGLHFNNSVQINASLYTYEYDNYQDQVNVYDRNRNDTVNIVENAPEARNTGFEIEALWAATDRITLGGNYSYTDTEYSDDYYLAVNYDQEHPRSLFGEASGKTIRGVAVDLNDDGSADYVQTMPSTGIDSCNIQLVVTPNCDYRFNPADPADSLELGTGTGLNGALDMQYQDMFIVNAEGESLKGIPETKFTVWGSYDLPTDIGSFVFWASYSYTGDQYAQGYKYKLDYIPDRYRADLSITWRDPDERWSARLFVNNVTDEQNVRGVGNSGEGTNWRQTGSILTPRFYGIDIRYRYSD